MKLIGRYLSPFTRRVAVTLELLGIPYDNEPINAWQNLEDVRRANPVGRIPALVLDDGEVLFDSHAIIDHLDEVAGPDRALTPRGGAQRRHVMRLTVAAVGIMEKAAAARYELVMRPEDKRHEPWLTHNLDQVHCGLAWLDKQVQGPWMTGDDLTQADVTAVVLYDFLRLFTQSGVTADTAPAIDTLARHAARIPAFSRTQPTAG